MSLIEMREVSKLYGFGDATTVALDEVSLTIAKGEFVAIMGPSGSGKTTLMNVIGLLDHPTHGQFLLDTRVVSRMTARRRAKLRRDKVGFVFQSFNLLPRLSVIDNVALPLAYKGYLQTKRHKRASVLLERMGLQDREYYFPYQLSGGQMQQVAIARALINNPSIIIADEPTGNLDSVSSRVVMEILSEVHKSGNTVLMVTHNPELTRYASRVVFMRDGAIVQDELSSIGEIPADARKLIHTPLYKKTEEDDLAGVSALMKAIPAKDAPETKKKRARKTKKVARSSRRVTKR